MTKRTGAIIGGGISGLSAAYALHRRRVPCLLLEATSRLGGVIRAERRDGCTRSAEAAAEAWR